MSEFAVYLLLLHLLFATIYCINNMSLINYGYQMGYIRNYFLTFVIALFLSLVPVYNLRSIMRDEYFLGFFDHEED